MTERDLILAFYDELCARPGLEFAEAARRFARLLFREREMPGCHVFTSHAALCISRFPTYQERAAQPLLSVAATGPDRLHFQLRVETWAKDEVYRAVTHSTNCPAERGLEEFDRHYAMFLAAHAPTRSRTAGGNG